MTLKPLQLDWIMHAISNGCCKNICKSDWQQASVLTAYLHDCSITGCLLTFIKKSKYNDYPQLYTIVAIAAVNPESSQCLQSLKEIMTHAINNVSIGKNTLPGIGRLSAK